MAYRTTKSISKVDRAYLAGFIEGEGTITMSRRHKGANRYLAITISNNEKEILEWVKHILGVGIIISKRVYSKNHNPSFSYAVYNRQALELLSQIALLLKGYKKRRAIFALDGYLAVTPRNGKYSEELLNKRKKYMEDFFKIKPIINENKKHSRE